MASSKMFSGISDLEKLEYSISKYSSFSTNFHPCNIQEDKPTDQSSRWSSETNTTPQFITLKLKKFAIVHTITFGKYEKTHVCNLKKFKIYGGLDEDNMVELLEGGLKNDNRPESFMLRYKAGGRQFACRYIKIVPVQSWGSTFNFTVWFVELIGNTRWAEVCDAVEWLTKYQKNETVRFCMKFLRQMNYKDAFNSLCKESSVILEHPAMSELFDIINSGNYAETEKFIDDAVENGMMNNYISRLDYKAMWEHITPKKPRPGMRGGHQMCLDPYSETIYLLGGWNGQRDLSDLWAFYIPSNSWSLLSGDTYADGGPSPRSCHKVCIDCERQQIFVLGRYLDVHCRNSFTLKSDFYVYDIGNKEWTKICDDTSAMGGPRLIFDHQMCMDTSSRTLYVFGGRILQAVPATSGDVPSAHTEAIYSGLYSYHVSTNTWCQITDEDDQIMRSRVGHSMLYHPIYRKLYVFAGQRNKDYLNDFFSYNIDTGVVEYLCEGCSRDCNNLPGAGFTQRATIDPDLNEIYVLSGLSKDKDKHDDHVQNSFWVFYIQQNKWSCIYKSETPNAQYWNKMYNIEPCPRYAHQLVYDTNGKIHYLFGGNPGMTCLPKLRLDDFWKLDLTRPSNPQLRRLCKILIRKCRFQELAYGDTSKAMYFLQNELGEVIDHSNLEECSQFAKLATCLFDDNFSKPQSPSCTLEISRLRARLFDSLSAFFPDTMTQPKANLSDLVPL